MKAILVFCKKTKGIGEVKMVHVVYCDNTGKNGERVLDKILSGTKTMIIRGAAGRKIPHSRVFEGETLYFMEKGTALCQGVGVIDNASLSII